MTSETLHDLKYVEEHLTCRHYLHSVDNGFIYLERPAAFEFTRETDKNELVMLLEGRCEVAYGSFAPHTFGPNEMFLVPRSLPVKGLVMENSKFLLLQFDVPLNNCDKLALSECWDEREQIDYVFEGIPIRYPVTAFTELMCYLLKNSMNCEHLHEIKQKELFFLLRGYYTKHEVAQLFYPIMAQSVDFKNNVLAAFRPGIKADDLIAMSNMSRSVFYKKFDTEFGMSVNKWIARQVAARIEFLAAEHSMNAKEIMYETGFDSASSFNRFCKRELGCTPTQLLSKYESTKKRDVR